jgi:CHAT domain-containing protein
MNRYLNKLAIDNVRTIFLVSDEELDSEAIEGAVPQLQAAQAWAKEHHFSEDENDALWYLYKCYSHMENYPQAIETLQILRTNLETIRSHIRNPLQRAGVIDGLGRFRSLFRELCRLCYRNNRVAELLDAMEGAKGRALAEVLVQKRGQVISDQKLPQPSQYLPDLMQQVKAHYLSYFVDDETTYAVLVAKDGSLHTQAIPIGKTKLKELLHHNDDNYNPINPNNWNKAINPRKNLKVISDLPQQLAPLISWLEPLAKSGLIQRNDHICYCPDEQLHLIPFHYLPFQEEYLVNYVSLSRIHGVSTLTHLLKRDTLQAKKFTVVQVWSQDDLGNPETPEKIAAFCQVGEWLADKLSGNVVTGEQADLPTITQTLFKNQIVHFATHGIFPLLPDQEKREINPFLSSGLLIAKNGQLPPNSQSGEDSSLLTPQQVLDLGLNFEGSHVTMQACVSGLAKEGIGGDALGLEWAFLQTGANSLLSSHWNVDAVWAAKFSIKFYQKWLAERVSRAMAWRETVLELMEESPNPYHWSAFSLSGDWR